MHPHVPPDRESEDETHKSTTTVDGILKVCPALLWKQNESGDTALHIAARYGRYGIVETLILATKTCHQGDLEQGCEISSEDAPLQLQKLIRKTNKKKDTALHEAVRFHYGGLTLKLTEADPEFSYSVNDAGETPLYLAVERGYIDCCDAILKCCKNRTYEGPNGRTALHAAVIFPDGQEMTRALLKSERTLAKAADKRGVIPLHIAADFGNLSTVKVLLECDKSTAYVADNDGRTSLHFATSKGHLDIMKVLLKDCPDCCELVDNQCRNVLHYAIKSSQVDVVDFVLKDLWLSNVLLNGKDANGNAPLHHLAHYPSLRMDYFVLDAKVDIMLFNKENLNAIDIIANEDNISKAIELEDIRKMLKSRYGRPGYRVEIHNDDGNEVEEENQGSRDTGERLMKAKETQLVVATLIATVTFAAGFTMPGGYHSESGSDQGSPILSRNTAFKGFVITNTLATAMSSCSVLVLLYSSIYTQRKYMNQIPVTFYMVVNLTMLALIAMVIAFVAGTYAVLGGHSPGLALAALVLGCFFFYFFAHSILSLESKILKAPHFLRHLFAGIGILISYLLFALYSSILFKLRYRPQPAK